MFYIYKITNDVNDKVYVGKTSMSIDRRWGVHRRDSKKERCKKRPLYSAIREYGVEHFSIELIETVDDAVVASEREMYWIGRYNSFECGYNATLGGLGKFLADYELVYKLFQLGKSNKEIQEITGYDHNTITRILRVYGVSSESRLRRGRLGMCKPVSMIDRHTAEVIKTFDSVNDAERFLQKRGGHRHISEVCAGRRGSAYGYVWEYIK